MVQWGQMNDEELIRWGRVSQVADLTYIPERGMRRQRILGPPDGLV